MQKRCKFPAVIKSFTQFFIALFAYFVCLSRVRDHKHRLTDVVGGAATGIALGAFFVSFFWKNVGGYRLPEYLLEIQFKYTALISGSCFETNPLTVWYTNPDTSS